MPIFPPNDSVLIEPQHDGIIMLNSDKLLFNDANVRPDGQIIFHIFEQCLEDDLGENNYLENYEKDFFQRRNELFSKASSQNLQHIQQALLNCGICMQEVSNSSDYTYEFVEEDLSWSCNDISELSIGRNAALLQYLNDIDRSQPQRAQIITSAFENIPGVVVIKLLQFSLRCPLGSMGSAGKAKLLRRLHRRGVFDVVLDEENLRVSVKTLRTPRFVLQLLKKVDPNAKLLSSSYEVWLSNPDRGR